jgi:hypothetical protein
MRKVMAGAVVVTSLAYAAAASAGGWATVAMSSHPSEAKPGKPWTVDLTVLQHGRTPLVGVRPVFTITNVKTGAERDFPAKPTSRDGVYRTTVVFPTTGPWDYEIDDGFSQVHSYAPVTIGSEAAAPADEATPPQAAPAPASDDGAGWVLLVALLGAIGVAVLLGAAGAVALARRHGASGAGT